MQHSSSSVQELPPGRQQTPSVTVQLEPPDDKQPVAQLPLPQHFESSVQRVPSGVQHVLVPFSVTGPRQSKP
jgi:hypothetical protein